VRGSGAILRHKITDIVSPENVRDVWNQLTDMSQATRLNSIEVIKLISWYLFIYLTTDYLNSFILTTAKCYNYQSDYQFHYPNEPFISTLTTYLLTCYISKLLHL